MGCDSRILKAGSGYAMPPFKTTQSPKLSHALAKEKGGGAPISHRLCCPREVNPKSMDSTLGDAPEDATCPRKTPRAKGHTQLSPRQLIKAVLGG